MIFADRLCKIERRNMNIQIGGHSHKDGEIDNPEFYYQAMDIINKHKLASEQAKQEREQDMNKTKPKQETNILVYVIAVIIVCLLFLR